ncbi:TatD family hydrolase [Nitrosomonas sp.]|uniref:TatD family hydrolase n=1 Tax=Nitrosomonas sp. TaxID=42353 RepID=UPI001D472DB4|nr:TatD family hydrolase [Nitrosomonas sp.]MCB1948145.1 TatD family hydrolase [Nitrosomonas sp.]MCP5242917.1 TatD family hydrolase [Burkholderiales bacterium]MCP5291560.1 TatD family hydrolase [Burkholderiales bacterium]MDR4515462.1 TatD family hydrolase [Nitrosomonas sp.]
MFVDSHCHLDFPDLAGNLNELLRKMVENQVTHALCVSVNLTDFPRVLALAQTHDNLFASVGVHPDYENLDEPDAQQLVQLANHPKVIAIGETGLDYYRLQGDLEWQRERFRQHIRAAIACNKPLIIHTRSAADDTLRIMQEEGADRAGGVMHCFTESWEVAQQAIEMNFYISFSGIVTFKNATALKDVARKTPLDRMLIETDSPYLAPVPYRGKMNQPAFVRYVAEEIARLRDTDLNKIAAATTGNFFRLFRTARDDYHAAH